MVDDFSEKAQKKKKDKSREQNDIFI